jgi:uncharacterized membrane protein
MPMQTPQDLFVHEVSDIRPLLDKYNVRYIYVGELERAYYDDRALRKFDRAVAAGQLTLVYDHQGVRIYRYDAGVDLGSSAG